MFLCKYMTCMCRYPWKPGEDIKSLGPDLQMGVVRTKFGFSGMGPREDQQIVLPAEPSLQSPIFKNRWILPSKSNITVGLEKWLSGWENVLIFQGLKFSSQGQHQVAHNHEYSQLWGYTSSRATVNNTYTYINIHKKKLKIKESDSKF